MFQAHMALPASPLTVENDSTLFPVPALLCCLAQVVLEVKGETQLRNLSAQLQDAGVQHKLWVEQPEDYPTCLATKPYRRSEVGQHFRKLQLCKAALGSKASAAGAAAGAAQK